MRPLLRTLYSRLAVALALLLVGVGTVVAVCALRFGSTFMYELEQRFNRDLARQLLVQLDMAGKGSLNETSIKALFDHYMHINPAIEIYLLDGDGRILAFEAPEKRVKRQRVEVAPIRHFLAGGALPILGDDPRSESRQKIFSAAALPLAGPTQQYLYVVLGGEDLDSVRNLVQNSYLMRFSLTAIAGVVVFSILAGALTFHLLTRRLRHLSAVMDGFHASGFRAHATYTGAGSEDELDRLGATFNAMAVRIREQMQALETKDELRRNLVANVSHDLRTPLAALRGYLETLSLEKPPLERPQRQHYLAVAHRQSERLTRLVDELFELSKLDAAETLPQQEPVAMGELLADVAQKFRLEAERRNVRIETAISQLLPLVSADVAMMERVLGNLTDNACRHTPAGGRVCLNATLESAGIIVSVANDGPAIPASEQAYLFNRFYQSPNQHRGGAGLGLAIVRRILELHGTTVAVSREGEQNVFRFCLPAVTKT